MVVDWDEAQPVEDGEEDDPDTRRGRLLKWFTRFLPVKT